MTTLYRADDPNLLTSVLSGEGVHLEPGAVLDGLTTDQAHAKPHGLPHSIAEIVAHMSYWQEWFNNCAVAGFTGIAGTCRRRLAGRSTGWVGRAAHALSPRRRGGEAYRRRIGLTR